MSRFVYHACYLAFCVGPLLAQDASWPFAGQNVANTRFAAAETIIGTNNASKLQPRWTFTAADDISATPAVDDVGKVLYFPDWAGNLYKVNSDTGEKIWSHSMTDYGLPSGTITRCTPTISGNVITFGASATLAQNENTSGFLVTVDAGTGNLIWKMRTDPSPNAVMTASPMVYQGVIYVGISSSEEKVAQPTFRGSFAAYSVSTGQLLWRTYLTPVGYTGVPVWSNTPVIDTKRKSVYITTGNNYTVPTSVENCEVANKANPALVLACQDPTNYFNSVVALDLDTGVVKWTMHGSSTDAWKLACVYFGPTCPNPKGSDFDFGAGATLFSTSLNGVATDILGAGQKSGVYFALNPDNGAVIWMKAIGPGGKLGGIQWGTAVDNQRIYAAISNSTQQNYKLQPSGQSWNGGSWAAVAPDSGAILWQVPDPGMDPVYPRQPAMAMGPLTVANGVVYAPSMSGKVYALSAATGATLWSFDTSGSVGGGAAVVNGTVYWGSGYGHFGGSLPIGTHNNKLFAFSIPN